MWVGKEMLCDAETAIEWNTSWHNSLILLHFIKERYVVYSVPWQMMLRRSEWTERVLQILFIVWGSVVSMWTTYSQSHSLSVTVHSTCKVNRTKVTCRPRRKGQRVILRDRNRRIRRLIYNGGGYNNKRGYLAPHLGLRDSVAFGTGQSVILIRIPSPWQACDRGSD